VRKELESLLTLARNLPVTELPQLIGALAEVNAVALMRLSAPAAVAQPDKLLDVQQAARRLRMSADYLYRHHSELPFTRPFGRKILFSSNGIDLYLKKSAR
jgi:excisionase family DNA binding protein